MGALVASQLSKTLIWKTAGRQINFDNPLIFQFSLRTANAATIRHTIFRATILVAMTIPVSTFTPI